MGHIADLSSDTVLDQAFINLQKPIHNLHLRADLQHITEVCLEPQDQIELILLSQSVEIWVRSFTSKPALKSIECLNGELTSKPSGQSQKQLQQNSLSAVQLKQEMLQFDLGSEVIDQLFELQAENTARLIAHEAVNVYVWNTCSDLDVCSSHEREEIQIKVHKAQPKFEYLPPPLAKPIQEIHIPRASARSYLVKKGQWIQVIDVAGKQCSDFLAFDAEALARGEEIGLDAVATRTVLGHSTPKPGLHSRFYGTDLHSMVEVVQDTVGRHDMFLTACSPKFYNDAGYFGHISCSDNFNQILKNYGIAPRTSWPAINFFYNTMVEHCGTISMDEPWSQPGDYILMRANRDLVCASSACPDDIDPSNGWIPTDIHIRIYAETETFKRSQHYRLLPEEQPRMTQSSGFFNRIKSLTSRISEYKGFWIANEYDGFGATAEYFACRERVALLDLSVLRKFDIVGPDAETFLQSVLTRNIRKLAIGEIAYSASCLETGGMIDDGTIFKLGLHNFRWVCGDEFSGIWLKQKALEMGFKVSIRNATSQIHNLAVQGPNSRALLRKIIWTPEHQPDIEHLAWFHFTLAKLGGPQGIPLMVSRTGYTGELGYEIWCHPNHAEQLWDSIWEAGKNYGLAPMGFDALDMLRIEAGLIFANHEFDAHINPYEAGIGFTVPMKTKEEDFIGKEAMQNQNPASRHKLMGLILDGNESVNHGDEIYAGRFPVGVVTSCVKSPLLKKPIALCRLAPEYANIGTCLEVGLLDGHKKRLSCKVTSLPFYDPERTRVRS
ncbi:aminomethyltransferase (plasmid) [Acinetobacter sp. NCu2D-2]|uniref:DUF1989 domain-containing protein n=1 Tax=Acinetobacter sp. NCu2D-2 TaxID=1608473 RepID=UPI0007CDF5F8|nr:aminomethyltransferase family protein [Acinetobacter sp. NCu2D-2]ANF83398.1 aminomethyltransferase [Acinetobacter sp. NCu2D-2]